MWDVLAKDNSETKSVAVGQGSAVKTAVKKKIIKRVLKRKLTGAATSEIKTDNDIEESTFELSLFAESFYEMLQYEMASRILTFLQKLRIKFVTKRNQKKRLREEMEEKDKERKRPAKQLKTNELPVNTKAVDPESTDNPEDQNTKKKEDVSVDKVNEAKLEVEEETDYEEDPEEDPEEDEEMDDPEDDSSDEKTKEEEKPNLDAKDEKLAGNGKEKAEENSKETKIEEAKPVSDIVSSEKQDAKVESGKKEPPTVKEVVIDKELLQNCIIFVIICRYTIQRSLFSTR
ncbi:protein SHORT ROOT IN SALT MEDIUM 1-like [Euphorbia lathyris]|uniref:protein SHORT ROOT IN SALT MEDIUM 1-like n=1 Tax=Euphorbia lathyris TaxID=212925 RepID=UPI0033139C83